MTAQLKEFERFEQISVLPLLQMIKKFYDHSPRRYKLPKEAFSQIWQYWENDNQRSILNCDTATEYNALCSVAIARPLNDPRYERSAWGDGSSHSVMNLYSRILITNGDSKISRSYCSLDISNYIVNPDKKNSVRINYTTNDSAMEFHKVESDMFKLFKIIEQNFADRNLHDDMKKFLSNDYPWIGRKNCQWT